MLIIKGHFTQVKWVLRNYTSWENSHCLGATSLGASLHHATHSMFIFHGRKTDFQIFGHKIGK